MGKSGVKLNHAIVRRAGNDKPSTELTFPELSLFLSLTISNLETRSSQHYFKKRGTTWYHGTPVSKNPITFS
jgi:hypothetical protein